MMQLAFRFPIHTYIVGKLKQTQVWLGNELDPKVAVKIGAVENWDYCVHPFVLIVTPSLAPI